jgi:hypothetical protein
MIWTGPGYKQVTDSCEHSNGTLSFIKDGEFHQLSDFFSNGATAASGPRPPHYRGFTIILRHTPLGRTPPDEWSARRRNLYLTTHNTHKETDIHAPGGIRTHNPRKQAAADPSLRTRGRAGINLKTLWVMELAAWHYQISNLRKSIYNSIILNAHNRRSLPIGPLVLIHRTYSPPSCSHAVIGKAATSLWIAVRIPLEYRVFVHDT